MVGQLIISFLLSLGLLCIGATSSNVFIPGIHPGNTPGSASSNTSTTTNQTNIPPFVEVSNGGNLIVPGSVFGAITILLAAIVLGRRAQRAKVAMAAHNDACAWYCSGKASTQRNERTRILQPIPEAQEDERPCEACRAQAQKRLRCPSHSREAAVPSSQDYSGPISSQPWSISTGSSYGSTDFAFTCRDATVTQSLPILYIIDPDGPSLAEKSYSIY
ncbi:uncharacterized protein LOC135818805 [Sycon ciliatum]|uniref:uncharacterized protein LOC135818805 n=1 Tax=Sycon ciliatum TaxID=27933 RepID=UPI0031F65E17